MTKKMKEEYDLFLECKTDNESGGPISTSDMYKWKIDFCGPKNSDYEGAKLHVRIEFPLDYPQTMPTCYFLNEELLHPNINSSGKVCFGSYSWNSNKSVIDILNALLYLLKYPNFDSGYDNKQVADFYKADPEAYHRTVKEIVAEFCKY